MILEKIYETGKNLGLTESDVDNILSTGSTELDVVGFSPPVEVYKGPADYGTISIKDFKGEWGRVFPNKIYEIGKKLGLTRNDVASILSSGSKEQSNVGYTAPVEIYKGPIEYGTISIKDFANHNR